MIVILLSGFLAGLKLKRGLDVVKAVLLVYIEAFAASIVMTFISSGLILLAQKVYEFKVVPPLFSSVLIGAVVAGIMLTWLNKFMLPYLKFDATTLTIAEYIIQWSLIYITIYQVIFDNLFPTDTLEKIEESILVTSFDVSFFVLPALISVWIGVAFYRVSNKHFEG